MADSLFNTTDANFDDNSNNNNNSNNSSFSEKLFNNISDLIGNTVANFSNSDGLFNDTNLFTNDSERSSDDSGLFDSENSFGNIGLLNNGSNVATANETNTDFGFLDNLVCNS